VKISAADFNTIKARNASGWKIRDWALLVLFMFILYHFSDVISSSLGIKSAG
jgi:hypothetical protein